METDTVFETCCLVFRISDNGQSPKSRCYHRQNPLESTGFKSLGLVWNQCMQGTWTHVFFTKPFIPNFVWYWFCHISVINWLMKKNHTGILCIIMQWHVLWTVVWMHQMKSSVNRSYIKGCGLCAVSILVTFICGAHRKEKCTWTLQEIQENIRHEIPAVPMQQLQYVSRSTSSWCEACLEAEGCHFKIVL
jgi:hypothetical protein